MPELKKRPDAPLIHRQPDEHRRLIAQRANAGLPDDGSGGMQAPLCLAPFSASDLPDATLWEGCLIYIPGEGVAASDGKDWINMSLTVENQSENLRRGEQMDELIKQLRLLNAQTKEAFETEVEEGDIEEIFNGN